LIASCRNIPTADCRRGQASCEIAMLRQQSIRWQFATDSNGHSRYYVPRDDAPSLGNSPDWNRGCRNRLGPPNLNAKILGMEAVLQASPGFCRDEPAIEARWN